MATPGENGADIPAGSALALEMLKQLTRLNDNIEKSHKMYEEMRDTLADLTDYHETYMRATEILIEKSESGKNKFSVGDVCKAIAEAAGEVMGEEDEEEEDDPGEEDPLVRRRG